MTAINIINEQSALIIFSTWLQGGPSKEEFFPRIVSAGSMGLSVWLTMVLDKIRRRKFSDQTDSSVSMGASRDAKSAAVNLNNFGIFLTLKNICDNNLISE